ncbi:hypothetical protein [Halosimplex salinum]|uniref:hypothetical protein n=1 Tax=Halosimplex salinum TaxID=1710538 RepID=UPI0013DE5E3D|nr:hypothetical protein [Halosimplex salinum]
MPRQDNTVVQCTDCERVYAAYYTSEGEIRTPAGEFCPNCDGDRFLDLPEVGI